MGLFYDESGEFARVVTKNNEKYTEYINSASNKNTDYIALRDRYNGEISVINNERISMRSEINILYSFLKSIGGSMCEKITIFEFQMEFPAIYEELPYVHKIEKPSLEEKHWMMDSLAKNWSKGGRNKDKIEKFKSEVEQQENNYSRDLIKRDNTISFIKDANEIATIYRQIIVIVRDTIKNKILPELGLIKAFLYADAIRESVVDSFIPNDIHPCSIEEYRGTAQDIHYQFVKNTFDFYNIATNFFKQKILTNIVEDKEVTKQEKDDFMSKIESIKESVRLVEQKKVL